MRRQPYLLVLDLALFREVERSLLDNVFDDASEDTACCHGLKSVFELLVAVGEECRDQLLVLDIYLTGLGVTSVFEVIL